MSAVVPPVMVETAPPPPQTPTSAQAVDTPYKELDYFDDAPVDRERFGGRSREIREIFARIATGRTFVLYGRSGLGKTSLLKSGVFQLLRDNGYLPVYVRALEHPLADVAAAVSRAWQPDHTDAVPQNLNLDGLIRHATSETGQTLVLVFDQFEEFFIRFRGRDFRAMRAIFVKQIAALVQNKALPLCVVFSLREDYLAALDEFQSALPDLFGNSLRLLPLTAFGAREAITLPLKRSGIPYDESLVTRLLDDLAEFDFDSARLQVACAEIYRRARETDGSVKLSTTSLDGVAKDGLKQIFRFYLNRATAGIADKQQLLARTILDALLTGDSTRHAMTQEELVASQTAAREEVEKLTDLLVQNKLLRRETRVGKVWVELIHECLIDRLTEWLDDNDDFQNYRTARDQIRQGSRSNWIEWPELLLSADVVCGVVGPSKESLQLSSHEQVYVLRSAIYRQCADAVWWIDRTGREAALDLLENLLRDPDANYRAGAAATVARLTGPRKSLVERCRELSLDSQEPEAVGQAAATAFAAHATREELKWVRKRVGWWGKTEPVQRLLGELHLQGYLRQPFLWVHRLRADHYLKHRFSAAIEKWADEHRNAGMIAGLLAGILWTVSSGLLTCAATVFSLSQFEVHQLGYYLLVYLLSGGICAIVGGAVYGRALSSRVAWSLILYKTPVRLQFGWGMYAYVLSVLVLSGLILLNDEPEMAIFYGTMGVFPPLVRVGGWFLGRCTAIRSSVASKFLFLVGSNALLIGIPIILLVQFVPLDNEDLDLGIYGFSLAFSLLIFVHTVTLMYLVGKSGVEILWSKLRRARIMYGALAAGALLMPLCFLLVQGTACLPWAIPVLHPRLSPDAGGMLKIHEKLHRGQRVAYVPVEFTQLTNAPLGCEISFWTWSAPRITGDAGIQFENFRDELAPSFTSSEDHSAESSASGSSHKKKSKVPATQEFLLVAAPRQLISVRREGEGLVEANLELMRYSTVQNASAPAEKPLRLTDRTFAFLLCRVSPASDGLWEGTIHCSYVAESKPESRSEQVIELHMPPQPAESLWTPVEATINPLNAAILPGSTNRFGIGRETDVVMLSVLLDDEPGDESVCVLKPETPGKLDLTLRVSAKEVSRWEAAVGVSQSAESTTSTEQRAARKTGHRLEGSNRNSYWIILGINLATRASEAHGQNDNPLRENSRSIENR